MNTTLLATLSRACGLGLLLALSMSGAHAVGASGTKAAAASAGAQMEAIRVYRCGPDGRSFSQSPCAEGQAVDVTRDERSADQRAQSQAAARFDAAHAERLRSERLAREAAAARPLLPASVGPVRSAAGSKSKPAPGKAENKNRKRSETMPKKPRVTSEKPARG